MHPAAAPTAAGCPVGPSTFVQVKRDRTAPALSPNSSNRRPGHSVAPSRRPVDAHAHCPVGSHPRGTARTPYSKQLRAPRRSIRSVTWRRAVLGDTASRLAIASRCVPARGVE